MKQICDWHHVASFPAKLALFSFIITLFLSNNLQAGGITIITHGYYVESFDWASVMRSAIADRAAGKGSVSLYSLYISNTNNPSSNILNLNSDDSLGNATSGEAIIYLDWRNYSTEGHNIENVADTVVQRLILDGCLLQQPIYLIGHSRGGWLVGEIAGRLAQRNIWVDQVTFLDPAAITISEYFFNDPQAEPYDNIVFADEYCQTNQFYWLGYPLNWVYLKDLSSIFVNDSVGGNDHTTVHDWYHGTIDTSATNVNDRRIDRTNWYNNDFAFGYDLSRIGHNEDTNALRSLIRSDGLSIYHGGISERDSVARPSASECWPNIMIRNCGSYQVQQGQSIRINAIYNTPANSTIQFLTDNDSNPNTSSTGREITSFNVSASQSYLSRDSINYEWYPTMADNGKYLYTKITANNKTRYYYLPQVINVTATPVINLTNGTASPASGTTADAFRWSVHYTDSTGNEPQDQEKKVYIDGTPYTMSLVSGAAADGTYEFGGGGLAVGVYNYYFQFKASNGTIVRDPTSGIYSGPTVSSSPDGSGRCKVSVFWGSEGFGQNGSGGYVDPNISWSSTYSAGQEIWFTVYTNFGWQLDRWYIRYTWQNGELDYKDPDGTNGNSAMLRIRDAERDANNWAENGIYCRFKRIHEYQRILTLSAVGPGYCNPAAGAYERNYNSSVTVTAITNVSGRFLEWRNPSGERVSTNVSYTFTMNEDKTFVAAFSYIQAGVYTTTSSCLEDASIRVENLDDNFGDQNDIRAGHISGSTWESLLNFDISEIPSDATISNATLFLYQTGIPSDDYGFEVQKTTEEWHENTIVGNNPSYLQPYNYNGDGFKYVNDYPAWASYDLSGRGLNVSSWIISWKTQNYGIRIRPVELWKDRDYGGYYHYDSHEGSYPPNLRIVWQGQRLIPRIAVSPTNINVQTIKSLTTTNTTLNVRNCGQGKLYYSVADNANWLSLSGITNSTSTGDTKQVTLSFSDSGLSPATYTGTVSIADTDSRNSNATVQVEVLYTILGPCLHVSPTNLSITAASIYGTNPTNNTFWVRNNTSNMYGTLNYSITTNVSWMSVNPISGSSTGESDAIQIQYTTGLNTGVYNGMITVTAANVKDSPQAISVSMTVHPPAPSAPTGLNATDGSDTGKVEVTWSSVTWAASYELWRNTTGNTNSVSLITSIANTNYTDTTAVPGTLYYYWVKAVNYTDTSPMSSSNSGYRAISAPSGLTASDGTYTNKIRLTWNSATGAEGYNIFRHTVNNSSAASNIGNACGIGFYDTNSVAGTLYYYWVKATNTICNSDFSGVDTGYRMISEPINLTASDGTYTDKIQLVWNFAEGATTYSIWRNASNQTVSATNIGIAATTNYNDSNTVAGATYYYWVKASNDVCQSTFSSANYGHKAMTGAPVSPTNTTASDGIYSNMVLINWSVVTNATAYEIWRSSEDDFSLATKILTSDVSTNVYGDVTAMPGAVYCYWIKAKNANGTSGFGDPDDSGWRGMPPPDAVSATDGIFTNKVGVTWSAVQGATAYTVWRGTDSQSGSAINISGDILTNAYDDTIGENATVYYYWVKAKNATLTSDFGLPDTGYSKLLTPDGVTASDGAYADKVRIQWTYPTKASAYLIYRNTANDVGTATLLIVTPGTTIGAKAYYDDTSAIAETTYYYWVKATNSVCDSVVSGSDSGWRGIAPSISANPQAQTNMPGESISFSVTATGTMPLSYQWQKSGVNIAGATASSYTIGNVAKSDEGAYRCLVTNLCGSTLSTEVNLTVIDEGTLTAPTGVSASDGTFTDKVRVSWTVVSGASFYEVWRSINNNTSNASNLGTTAGTTYDNLTAATTPGTILYYWVKARTLVSASKFSYPDSGYCRPLTNSGSADLSISSVLFDPVVIQQGQHPGLLMMMLANNGPDAMNSSPVNFAFYLSGNDVFGDGDDHWMGDYSANKTIPVGGYTTVILSEAGLAGVTIPPVADGSYYVFAKAQHASTLTDPDDNNNVCKRTGTIQIGPTTAGLKIPVSGDFDGDGKADLALYQEATGTWQILLSGSGYGLLEVPGLGGSGLVALAGDFDGDGKDDPVIYNEATGDWTFWKSRSGYVPATVNLGGLGFKPVLGDYNGMLMEDLAVYQEARGYWLIILSETTVLSYYEFGADGYIPVTGDYDGDGKTDMALYERSSGNWRVKLSSAGGVEVSLAGFGGPGYVPVIADYDGDGKVDLALYNETTGTWIVRLSAAGYVLVSLEGFGGSGYVPVPGDFDGDGKADLVIYETATSTWTFLLSSMGYVPLKIVF